MAGEKRGFGSGRFSRRSYDSLYLRELDGLPLEIATIPPGFVVDETREGLGPSLTLPEWLESRRPTIEAALQPIAT